MNSITKSSLLDRCPRWDKCSAPICPVDPDFSIRTMTNDDPVCLYLIESVKRDAEARIRGRGLGYLYELMVEVYPKLTSRWSRIRRVLHRAMATRSRLDALKRGETK